MGPTGLGRSVLSHPGRIPLIALLSTCPVPGTVSRALYASFPLLLTKALLRRCYSYVHCTNEEVEVRSVPRPGSRSSQTLAEAHAPAPLHPSLAGALLVIRALVCSILPPRYASATAHTRVSPLIQSSFSICWPSPLGGELSGRDAGPMHVRLRISILSLAETVRENCEEGRLRDWTARAPVADRLP